METGKPMKTIAGKLLCVSFISTIFLGNLVNAQNDTDFTSANATPEKAIQLYWNSNTNELYEIDYADSLIDTNTGATTWNTLYTDFPSQGTNTFIADCGNYDISPEIVHPRLSPMRFYRVVLTGNPTSPTNPTVIITSPTNGATLSGDVVFSVSATSPELITDVLLYIDGEQQWRTFGGTNFIVNTCEWLNGSHTIFAIAKSQSGIDGFTFGTSVTYGYATSPLINVTFNNLISEVDFSQPYFEPSLAETQQVTAQFAANCNWTLKIQNVNSNTVRHTSGSGGSMSFNWDGTGDGETNIPDGVYSYVIAAQTNGLPLSRGGSGGMMAMSDFGSTQSYVVDDSGNVVPLALYPPGFDTTGFTIFDATASDIQSLRPEQNLSTSSAAMTSQSGAYFASSSPQAATSPQSTRAPKRKPRVGVKNSSGTFGICYNTYPYGAFSQEPRTGWPYPVQPQFVGLSGNPPSTAYHYFTPLKTMQPEVDGFSQCMKIGYVGSYKPAFIKADGQWGPQDIEKSSLGGSSIFNTCNFGLLCTHGVYATHAEDDNIKYTYFLLNNPNQASHYVRLSDLDLGSTGQDGLRWFTTLACSILNPSDVTSMANNGRLPDNANLHLLLGSTTENYQSPLLGAYYATNMVWGTSIWQSLQNAATTAYKEEHDRGMLGMTITVTFRVMGYQSCIGDTLFQYNDPDPNTPYEIIDQTVFTP